MRRNERIVRDLLKVAGISVNGPKSYDMAIHDDGVYDQIMRRGMLGAGESYMDELWSCADLSEFTAKVERANLTRHLYTNPRGALSVVTGFLVNKQTLRRASKNAASHYNIGNDLYEVMLDKRMIYSCGYWAQAKTLDDAQTDKLDLICRKLELKPGMKLLDIGCGWGGFAEYAAKEYGARVTGISPALEQVKLARERTRGLSATIKQQDYRDVEGTFDRIVSIGMLEHVGVRNYATFFETCQRLLAPDGMMLHHTIGANRQNPTVNPWFDKYIFPGGQLPALSTLTKLTEKKWVIEDIHNFGPDYDKTLMAWYQRFTKAYPKLDHSKYDDRFYRMWEFYLLLSAGGFRARKLQLWQIVFRPKFSPGAYRSVR